MNDFNLNRLDSYGAQAMGRSLHALDPHGRIWQNASRLFEQAYAAGQFGRLRSWLTRRRSALYDLNQIAGSACSQHYAGLQSVPVDLIRGSEGRCADFDRDFHPLGKVNRERWIGVALAMIQGVSTLPISLVRVGDIYFVRDGHHRVSVARAWGQECIDAEVIVWDLQHPLPREQAVPAQQIPERLRGAVAL